MSTMMSDHPLGVVISTVSGIGKRKRLPRVAMLVHGAAAADVKAEVIRQATDLRKANGVRVTKEELVV